MQLSLEPVRMVNMKPDVAAAAFDDQKTSANPAAGGVCLGTVTTALQIYELSNLDQLYDHYNLVALFYDVNQSGHDTSDDHDRNGSVVVDAPMKKLQRALEELLVHQPAAAGRLCNSEPAGRLQIEYYSSPQSCHTAGDKLLHGVPFVVAHADVALSELGDVSNPHPSMDVVYPTVLAKTCQDSNGKYLPRPVMAMQVTTFTCGSFCLAHMCNHSFVDGHGAATFLQNMCSIARGAGLTVLPSDLKSCRREIMKPRIPPSPSPMVSNAHIGTRKKDEQLVAQFPYSCATRFAFSTAALEALRLKASSSSAAGQADGKPYCSRYQALTALLWTARAKSLRASSTLCPPADQELNLYVPTNLRGRGIPGLNREYTGNAIFHFIVSATLQELCESSLPSVVRKIKLVLEAGMDNLSECVQSQIDYIELQLRAGLVPHLDKSHLFIPSLVNLPFYDTDCGWGRPVYCARPSTKQVAQRSLIILDHPVAGAWNVLTVFNSQEEHAAFKQEIAEYILKN